jgi:hypothetical protein
MPQLGCALEDCIKTYICVEKKATELDIIKFDQLWIIHMHLETMKWNISFSDRQLINLL